MRRFFNQTEKTLLYIAADGKCENCGEELGAGWHADHIHPYSKNGATALVNGQALCPECNLKKGKDSMAQDLREWQQEALDQYMQEAKENFLAVATPGAGKTTWALTVANTLLERRDVQRIIVVVPSRELSNQWTQNSMPGVELREYDGTEAVDKAGYNGIVVSYQGVSGNVGALVARALSRSPKRTLVIFDEIHHAADQKSFGQALLSVFGSVERRLLLTGTPWRSDPTEKIPFCEFDEHGMLKVDYTYGYQRAIKEGVCRPSSFPAIGAEAEWVRNGEVHKVNLSVNESLKNDVAPDALRTLLDPDGEWMTEVLHRAHKELMSHRQEVPDAGGLVIARDKRHAERLAGKLRQITGINPPVVVSGEEGGTEKAAKEKIEKFRRSRDPWIVAVRMISEGVDIPRLEVGVYATNITTRMFFNQVLGRFVRVRRDHPPVTATLYVPPTSHLWGLVQDVEQMVTHALEEVDRKEVAQRERDGSGAGDGPSDFTALGTQLTGEDYISIGGEAKEAAELEQLELILAESDVPVHHAKSLLGKVYVNPTPEKEAHVPRIEIERDLREKLKNLCNKFAYEVAQTQQQINRRVMENFNWTPRGQMSVEQLERAIDMVEGWRRHGRAA